MSNFDSIEGNKGGQGPQDPRTMFTEEMLRTSVKDLYNKVANEKTNVELSRELWKLTSDIVDVIYETDLPEHFEVKSTTSATNESIAEKFNTLVREERLKDGLIPEYQLSEYPLNITDKEVLKKAPWVNMIHAWMKVVNQMNAVSAIQRGDIPEEMSIEAAVIDIAQELFKFTVESDGRWFIRETGCFGRGDKYLETWKREHGVESTNSERHVNYAEMRYILNTLKLVYPRK